LALNGNEERTDPLEQTEQITTRKRERVNEKNESSRYLHKQKTSQDISDTAHLLFKQTALSGYSLTNERRVDSTVRRRISADERPIVYSVPKISKKSRCCREKSPAASRNSRNVASEAERRIARWRRLARSAWATGACSERELKRAPNEQNGDISAHVCTRAKS
jgi:hypothetical protein